MPSGKFDERTTKNIKTESKTLLTVLYFLTNVFFNIHLLLTLVHVDKHELSRNYTQEYTHTVHNWGDRQTFASPVVSKMIVHIFLRGAFPTYAGYYLARLWILSIFLQSHNSICLLVHVFF